MSNNPENVLFMSLLSDNHPQKINIKQTDVVNKTTGIWLVFAIKNAAVCLERKDFNKSLLANAVPCKNNVTKKVTRYSY